MAENTVGRKRPKSYYSNLPPKKRARGLLYLSVGMQGVLITTNDKEKLCVSEAYNLLNEYADDLYGPEFSDYETASSDDDNSSKKANSDEDVEKAIAMEVKALKGRGKETRERRFQSVLSGARNVVFIECRAPVDPAQLVHRVLSDVRERGEQKTRYCLRMIPVTKICRANLGDIRQHADSVLQPHFHSSTDPQPLEFAVHYKCRNNQSIKRDDVIQMVASLVTDDGAYPHIVNLKSPQFVVCVEIIKTMCCMSVVRDFHLLRQYNIQMISEGMVVAKQPGPEEACEPDVESSTEIGSQSGQPAQPKSSSDAQEVDHATSPVRVETHAHSHSSSPESQPTSHD